VNYRVNYRVNFREVQRSELHGNYREVESSESVTTDLETVTGVTLLQLDRTSRRRARHD